ncbi:hypothetical protein VIGAN_01042900 [Vigna angularis var. angularis]|uniref:DUF7890 domain-containing protein n=2 Tax=Phaseolus angularis TaxID=3914 RepID=A0A0S3QXG5_PHAAN|nr:uncharacterized protein LOC108322893 [Vigna angularis]BAT72981.1 hypothetical protein VIGAN_01042900 [Vigna angularis var. angularis]
MIGSMFACFGGKVSRRKAKVEAEEVRKGVYRDELREKERARKKVKKSVRFAEVEATIMGEENEKEFTKRGCESGDEVVGEKEGVRVRVRLTKEEAARLLSKCNEGPLQLKDVAHQLLFIPVDRLSIQPSLYH